MKIDQVLIAIDQLANTVIGGWADETLSSRAWREKHKKRRWKIMRHVIDVLFFWQKEHCKSAYESELKRLQLPPEFRKPE